MYTRMAIAIAATLVAGCAENLTHPPDHQPLGEGGAGGGSGELSCVPNLDGRIDASELRAAYGVPVSYLVSPPGQTRTVDVAGSTDASGGRVWDFSQDIASDVMVTLSASPVTGKWYAASFPTADFTAPLDAAKTLDGIYRADDSRIALLGVASAQEKPADGQTLLVYTGPVDVYRFPLKPGAQWVSEGAIENGTLKGLPYAGKDTYDVADDATGTLKLHDLTFTQVHRVRTKVTVSPAAGATISEWQVGFVFECFGEVTRATSQQNETNENFTTAAEVRRLGQ